MLLLLLQSLPPLNFRYCLHSNYKEGMLLLVFLQYLPHLAVPLYWDLYTLPLHLNFRFHLNCK